MGQRNKVGPFRETFPKDSMTLKVSFSQNNSVISRLP